ncbi:MAG: diguanylate cyclase [Alphaproteobacteria bacterium]|nr:diguanylate cyclase [Alphaproteobacteria bacterium]
MSSTIDRFVVFPWNENFETGIAMIDEQHRKLVDALNELASTLVDDNSLEVDRVFHQLKTYADFHFECEENLWAEYFGDDPWFQSHQLSHSAFLPNVIDIEKDDTGRPQREVVESIVRFLIRWLAFHIIDGDMRMAHVVRHMQDGHSIEEAKLFADRKMSGAVRILVEAVLTMYESLSGRTLDLMRERVKRRKAELKLQEAYDQLQNLAITDKLTGLYNRHHFDKVFDRELKRAIRQQDRLCFIMLDVDHFKKLNDHYGHAEGDRALEKIGACLRLSCRRPADYAFRLGGEEFGILSLEESEEAGLLFAEKIRKSIEDLAIPHKYNSNTDVVTVSLGVVSKIVSPSDTLDGILKLADDRLYKAKQSGRNMVVAE